MQKLLFNDPRLNRKSFYSAVNNVHGNRVVDAHTYLRGAFIPPDLLDKRVAVYNGKTFFSFIVKKFMLGRKFGEFVLTKKLGDSIHAKIREKKKKKK